MTKMTKLILDVQLNFFCKSVISAVVLILNGKFFKGACLQLAIIYMDRKLCILNRMSLRAVISCSKLKKIQRTKFLVWDIIVPQLICERR